MTTRLPTVICPGSSSPCTRRLHAISAMPTRYGVAATNGMPGTIAPTVSFCSTTTRETEVGSAVEEGLEASGVLIGAPSSSARAQSAEAENCGRAVLHAVPAGLPVLLEIVDEPRIVEAQTLLARIGRHVAAVDRQR